MRIDPKDLVQAFQGNGDALEAFVHDLVRAVGWSCGIDRVNIDWDYRTNVKDGGRDLVVRVPNPRADRKFLPARPSIWSIKSGDDGIRPASLRNEILDPRHPTVRMHLQEGWAYVWCTVRPADQDQRDAMRAAANQVAEELNVNPGLIEFRWPEQLQGEVNLYPNLIPVHLPQVGSSLTDVLSLQQWGRQLELTGTWVDFGDREGVVRRVTEHLLGRERPNVLHIAGLSGIGKTRTVFEACRQSPELNGVFYVERFEQVGTQLYRYLEEDGRHVYLVIDEVPLDQVDAIMGRLGEFADRVRVVTIGPAMRQAATTRDEILILPEPDTDAGVLTVVRAAGAGLPDNVLRSIAGQSAHDLRLALLLVRASQRLPEFRGVPVVNIDGVWRRLMGLFAQEIGNPHDFRKAYEVLCISVDIGMADDVGKEVEVLARHFQYPVEHIREAALTSFHCGLGLRTRRFFEAIPRALAARLFAERVWPRIQDVFEDFFPRLPERLARRFLERCHDCTGPVREKVMARLGDFFLKALSGESVTVLTSRPASRLFQTWAEFDPGRGLHWLRNAVECATPQQLRALDGEPDGSGGWRGRRQLVWLCQNLASFSEHFEACEAILFRLALHETEPSIGNNSTVIWKSLFWPALAGTEVPFDQRLPFLFRRLHSAAAEELPLVVSAAIGCIEYRGIGLPVPPRVVGGRVVPRPWRPHTWGELGTLQREAGRHILDTLAALSGDRLSLARYAVAEHVQVFIRLGLLDDLRTLFRPDGLDEPLRRRLIASLEKQVAFLREGNQDAGAASVVRPIREWLETLWPTDVGARVRILTAQDYWSVLNAEERDARYARLADELIAAPETLRGLADWLPTPEARSAESLGVWLGRRDTEGLLAEVIREWLRGDRCRTITVGYLIGIAAREEGLPQEWAATLDALATDQPEAVAIATASADISGRGFKRLLALLDRLPTPASRFLHPLAFGGWLGVLNPEQRAGAAKALVRLADAGDPAAAEVGIDLIQMWTHVNSVVMDPTLAEIALNLVSRPLVTRHRNDFYAWRGVLSLLCPFYPRRVAEVVMGRITDLSTLGGWGDDEDVDVLTRAAAFDPSGVMEVVGEVIRDRHRRAFFGLATLHGLFEAIGLPHVAAWLEQHGRKHLRWLARHFPSPHLDESGRPTLPPLTEWLFREHEADDDAFRWFLMGRHSRGAVWSPADVDPIRRRQEMQPFLKHELRRVREWAEHELRHEEQEATFFREMDEEDERL